MPPHLSSFAAGQRRLSHSLPRVTGLKSERGTRRGGPKTPARASLWAPSPPFASSLCLQPLLASSCAACRRLPPRSSDSLYSRFSACGSSAQGAPSGLVAAPSVKSSAPVRSLASSSFVSAVSPVSSSRSLPRRASSPRVASLSSSLASAALRCTLGASSTSAYLSPRFFSSAAGASRRLSLFFSDPPPSYPISLHGGFKVQAALCIDRLPLLYQEPVYEKRWREFRDAWEAKTNNGLQLADDITFMKFPFHFFETEEAQKQREELISKTGDAEVSELELLLSEEGFSGTRKRQKDKDQKKKQASEVADAVKSAGRGGDDRGVRSLEREPTKTLYLIVRYGDSWGFPLEDRIHGQSMRRTLKRLCEEQLGGTYAPYLLGYSPFAYDKRAFSQLASSPILGRKVFYYRAHHVPGSANVSLPHEGPISDFAWVTRRELADYISPRKLAAVSPGLLLED
ncbi:hypothetical protein BESB_027880 [Besnoitia besnoiti]|uniref:Ribosomal protein L46 n=1 Tax=Besnoitia besnoiti TaxID=94643 RepID=A0A2A9M6U4_BESBE|nr:uncharacterized protein BESB_027880 [Besnoitia besnoiti]PFH31353.1 hypothetical protein BESB_027880 [Besnoitia besnoiti]